MLVDNFSVDNCEVDGKGTQNDSRTVRKKPHQINVLPASTKGAAGHPFHVTSWFHLLPHVCCVPNYKEDAYKISNGSL